MHPEAAVGPAATAPIRQHGEEGVFVDRVLTLADTFRAALVSRSEAIIRLATQTNESVAAPFHLKQTGRAMQHGSVAIHACPPSRAWTYSSSCSSQHSAGNHSDRWR